MYSIYKKLISNNQITYNCPKHEEPLFGYRSGFIPRILGYMLKSKSISIPKWSFEVEKALSIDGHPNHAVIINLKPNNKDKKLSIYELVKVWGYSSSDWTPIMLQLRGLFVDEEKNDIDEDNFTRMINQFNEPIFSMLYLNGSIANGELTGKWTAPRASPTNSVLLWPDTLKYFTDNAFEVIHSMK